MVIILIQNYNNSFHATIYVHSSHKRFDSEPKNGGSFILVTSVTASFDQVQQSYFPPTHRHAVFQPHGVMGFVQYLYDVSDFVMSYSLSSIYHEK